MTKSQFSVIIPSNVYPVPSQRELSAARILAAHFKADVTCQPNGGVVFPNPNAPTGILMSLDAVDMYVFTQFQA